MQQDSNRIGSQSGFTLLELMIVVAIIAIISAFAFPSYMEYVVNTKRTAATSALLQIADRQQQFFMDNKTYAANLTDLGLAAHPMFLSDDGRSVAAGDDDVTYLVTLAGVSATTYTAIAAPMAGQLKRDTECGTMVLNQAGTKDALGGGDDCW